MREKEGNTYHNTWQNEISGWRKKVDATRQVSSKVLLTWVISKCCSLHNYKFYMSILYILLQIKHFTVKQMKKYIKCIPTQRYCRCKAKTDSGSTFILLKLLTRRSKIVMSLDLINIFIPYFPWHLSSIQHCWPSSLPEKCLTLAFTEPYSPAPSFSISFKGLSPTTPPLNVGVSQGSSLGPCFLILYSPSLNTDIYTYGFNYHLYVKDLDLQLRPLWAPGWCSPISIQHLYSGVSKVSKSYPVKDETHDFPPNGCSNILSQWRALSIVLDKYHSMKANNSVPLFME